MPSITFDSILIDIFPRYWGYIEQTYHNSKNFKKYIYVYWNFVIFLLISHHVNTKHIQTLMPQRLENHAHPNLSFNFWSWILGHGPDVRRNAKYKKPTVSETLHSYSLSTLLILELVKY